MTLREWMDERNLGHAQVGKALGVPRQTVHLWWQGKRRPQLFHALAMVELTQGAVPLESWLSQHDKLVLAGIRAGHDVA